MRKFTLNNEDNIIDVRDVIERFEELESEREFLLDAVEECQAAYEYHDSDDTKTTPELADIVKAREELAAFKGQDEYNALKTLLSYLCGNGGDVKWLGDWYPITLIRDSYFEQYMDEMLEDCGELPKDLPCYLSIKVDYEALQMDYTSCEIDGVTYWYR